MKALMLVRALAVHAAIAAPTTSAAAALPSLDFSSATGGSTLPRGWTSYAESRHKPTAQMAVVSDGTEKVFRIKADHNAGAIIYKLEVSPAPMLSWRWKVDHSIAAADIASKHTDDLAARVYVFFDMPLKQLTIGERVKLRLARAVSGIDLPRAALCYVWDNKHAIGTIAPSAYYSKVMLVVLQSGDSHAGQWRAEHRDLAADYRAAFGTAAPRITGISLGADTDNTGGKVTAWFADVVLGSDVHLSNEAQAAR